MSAPKTVAFFGATGDCAGYCLAHALKEGYDCVALARTPSKLTRAMTEKGVGPEILDKHLSIVEGNARDVEAVKRALRVKGEVVDTIISGIGGVPVLQWSLRRPVTLTDPTICQDAGRTILEAAQQLDPTRKPLFISISTTGISPDGLPRDVPLLFAPLYHWFLQVPHEDKRVLSKALDRHARLPERERAIAGFINVKPSLLMDGEGKGLGHVRQGTDEEPAVGYTIQRGDAGLWIFERLVKSQPSPAWLNTSINITY